MRTARERGLARDKATAAVAALVGLLLSVSASASPPVATVQDAPAPPRPRLEPIRQEAVCPVAPTGPTAVVVLPEQPSAAAGLSVVAVSTVSALELFVTVRDEAGATQTPAQDERWGTSLRAAAASFSALAAGRYTAVVRTNEEASVLACLEFEVTSSPADRVAPASGVWEVRRDWDPAMEALYSAWIAKLFYVSPGAHKGWQPLHQATRDPTRNFLYGALGLREDNPDSPLSVKAMPDCADLPYHLRAYFAWKLGLPVLVNRCSRGRADTGSLCTGSIDNTTAKLDHIAGLVPRFNAFLDQGLSWQVQTGNLRTLPDRDLTDTYPLTVSIDALRPGAVFVDPGGHALVLSQYEPQRSSNLGTLYGVDAHPDRTITHKAFGPGTFVFNHRVPTGGFKAFRPVVRDGTRLRFLSNEEIDARPGYAPRASTPSPRPSPEAFYDEVFTLLNPVPPDPADVLAAKVEVLYAAMQDRQEAVQLGEEYMAKQRASTMVMPQGAEIFETVGPWETYSTPARDLRCLLAIDDVMQFPRVAAQNLSRYAVAKDVTGMALQAALTLQRDTLLRERTIAYRRSDGSPWTLTLAEIVARQTELEMAYNPNDCPELRWGARNGSEEMATCGRFAPAEQRFKMKMARSWFATRHRPDQR